MHASAVIDDAILLRSYAADGDAAAFAELVRRYADMVYATARRVTGSAAAAEDVAQDSFLRLAQCSAAITGSLAAWLHRTSLNRSLEVMRSECSRKRRETAALADRGPQADDSHELIARVDVALAALPEDLRVAVTEHFLCGRSQSDIAAALGVSQSSISRRIESGLNQLRQRLRADNSTAALALPMLLQGGLRQAAPQTVRASLTKIGLAGVRSMPSTIAPAAAATSAIITASTIVLLTAAICVVVHNSTKTARPGVSPAPAAAASAPTTHPASFLTDAEPDDMDDSEHNKPEP